MIPESRRLITKPSYLHHFRFSVPSVPNRWISVTRNHQENNINESPIHTPGHNDLLDHFDHLLRQSTDAQSTKRIHTQILLFGGPHSAFLASRLVSLYSRFELLHDARKVFETAPIESLSNTILWNAILRANVRHGGYQETLRVYHRMRTFGVRADGFGFPLILRACGMMGCLELCNIVHCHVLQMGLQNNVHVVNELLGMYARVRRMDFALQVFDRVTVRNHISWNTMVSGYAYDFDYRCALGMFRRMKCEGWEPNPVTWTSLLSSHSRCGLREETLQLYDVMRGEGVGTTAEALAVVISVCADYSDAFDKGRCIHGYAIGAGFVNYLFVKNSLLCLYGKHGTVLEAETLFSEIEVNNLVSWNALISSYAEFGLCDKAFAIFSKLERLHGYPTMKPDVITWSAVISGFASKGRGEESLKLFRQMQLAKVKANFVTLSSILSICAELLALLLGREIHAYVIRNSMDNNILVGNGLINVYTKCGSLREGHLAFAKMDGRDVFSWNTMITGYGMHGFGESAWETFNQMIGAGFEPDGVTFVAVLSACSHAGLVSEGRKLFNQMKSEYRIEPQIEHYSCMVDLLGRAGFLQEASEVVKSMPMQPNDPVWGALLNSCRMYKNKNLAETTAAQIFDLESSMSGGYMLLSNIYAETGSWGDSARVRMSLRTRGLKKLPGQSWIELKKKVHKFTSGNLVGTGMEEIYKMLKDLSIQMEMEGYDSYEHQKSFGLQTLE